MAVQSQTAPRREAVKPLTSGRDPLSARDTALASIDRERDIALRNLQQFGVAEERCVSTGDPSAILSAVRLGMEAIRAHLSELSRQRDVWVA